MPLGTDDDDPLLGETELLDHQQNVVRIDLDNRPNLGCPFLRRLSRQMICVCRNGFSMAPYRVSKLPGAHEMTWGIPGLSGRAK